MGDLGWLGAMFADDVGGFGGRFLDAALILEQLGSTLVPEPFLEALACGTALARGGDEAQRQRWLAPLIAGQTSAALAWTEAEGRFDPAAVSLRAEPDGGGGFRLRGEKRWVGNGHAADQLIVSARTAGGPRERAGISLFVVDRTAPGVRVTPVATMDGRRAAMIGFEGVAVDPGAALGGIDQGLPLLEAAVDVGAAATVAEGLGIAAATLQMTVGYLGTREQFGRKIGSFQALQHRAVDMFVAVELLRSIAILSALQGDADDPVERADAVSAAKVELSDRGRWVVRQAIQLHGGIGCTDEHDIGLYFKRMQVLAMLFGDDEHHVRRFSSLPTFTAGLAAGA
jgi:alkylation response protein AidB-like acyl-CoA dehydrogenase